MAKIRGPQISDSTIQTVHLVSGITVNGITLSGSQSSQKTLGFVNSLGLQGQAVSYNLDNFLAVTGGTVTGIINVIGITSGVSSVSVPSGASFSVSGSLAGTDLLQALADIDASVTASALKRLTDSSNVTTDHTHNFSAVGGRDERELVKVATQSADTITLDYGNFSLISIPNVTTLKSSDIEAFINGQLLEYGSPNGFTLNSTNGVVTFHPAISGDTLAVVWRGLDTTASGVIISYEPVSYPYPTGGGIETTEGLYANGGSPGDLYGGWANPTTSDGQPDIHMKLVVSGVAGLSRIDIKKDSTIVASTASGTGVPLFVFNGNISRSFPLTLDASGTFVFDLYFSTPSGVTSGNLLTASYTPLTGSEIALPGTGLPSSSASAIGMLVNIDDIYQNVNKEIANISASTIATPYGTISLPYSGDVFLAGLDQTLPPSLTNLPDWLTAGDLAANDWIKLEIQNFSASSSYEYFDLKVLHPSLDNKFSYSEKTTQLSLTSGIVAAIGTAATTYQADILDALTTGVTKPVFYMRKYLTSSQYDLTQSGRIFFELTTTSSVNHSWVINGSPPQRIIFLIAKGASYTNLASIHFDDPYRIQSDYIIPTPIGAQSFDAPAFDNAIVSRIMAQTASSINVDLANPRFVTSSQDMAGYAVDYATIKPLSGFEISSTSVDSSVTL